MLINKIQKQNCITIKTIQCTPFQMRCCNNLLPYSHQKALTYLLKFSVINVGTYRFKLILTLRFLFVYLFRIISETAGTILPGNPAALGHVT